MSLSTRDIIFIKYIKKHNIKNMNVLSTLVIADIVNEVWRGRSAMVGRMAISTGLARTVLQSSTGWGVVLREEDFFNFHNLSLLLFLLLGLSTKFMQLSKNSKSTPMLDQTILPFFWQKSRFHGYWTSMKSIIYNYYN